MSSELTPKIIPENKVKSQQSGRACGNSTSNTMTTSEVDLVNEIKELEATLTRLQTQRKETESKLKY
jgi:uncharacterized protein YlxW (UPF0749 family)